MRLPALGEACEDVERRVRAGRLDGGPKTGELEGEIVWGARATVVVRPVLSVRGAGWNTSGGHSESSGKEEEERGKEESAEGSQGVKLEGRGGRGAVGST